MELDGQVFHAWAFDNEGLPSVEDGGSLHGDVHVTDVPLPGLRGVGDAVELHTPDGRVLTFSRQGAIGCP